MQSIDVIGIPSMISAGIWPSGLSWWIWTIIIVVVIYINALISAQIIGPVGRPESNPAERKKQSLSHGLILSWPAAYFVIAAFTDMSESGTKGLIGAIIALALTAIVGILSCSKLFDTYHNLCITLGGSDAYAKLHRHVWSYILYGIQFIATVIGYYIWAAMK